MAPATEIAAIFPTPVFEGSEKRIEIDFRLSRTGSPAGLRALPRATLDALMEQAACCIVSARHNAHFDAYVLSESSFFVYPDKAVLKTCGTTKLLAAVAPLLELAASLGMEPRRAKYSRASFLFPEQQPDIHGSFDQETTLLRRVFAPMGGACSAYVLGDSFGGLQWHVFVADAGVSNPGTAAAAPPTAAPVYTLEVCMTGLCPVKAAQFARDDAFMCSAAVTAASGIRALLPGAEIDDYVFEPCGYSMNGIEGNAFSTIHITPEDGFSYASVELCGYTAEAVDAAATVAQIAAIFRPAELSIALSVDTNVPGCHWGTGLVLPDGYTPAGASAQELRMGGRVEYYTMQRSMVDLKGGNNTDSGCCTPRTVLAQVSSFCDSAVSDDSGSDLPALSATPSSSTLRSFTEVATPNGSQAPVGIPRLNAHFPPVPTNAASIPSAYSSDTESLQSEDGDASALKQGPIKPVSAITAVLSRHQSTPLRKTVPGDALSTSVDEHIKALVTARSLDDTFYVIDLGVVARLYTGWIAAMPRVKPFYAVKCNGDVGLLGLLAALGAGFDCASEAEVEAVLALGVPPERIVFANACKRNQDIRAVAARGIEMSTFDTECELIKIARWAPGSSLLLRIRADDPLARCQLGNKYGAEAEDVDSLLAAAARLGLQVDGVSFHVGSGASNPDAFTEAIFAAAGVFKAGAEHGFQMTVLDIGGGFAGCMPDDDGAVDLGGVPKAVNDALDLHFPPSAGVRIIAEPGRYFAETAATLITRVFGKRIHKGTATEAGGFDYWITDGLYGSMNSVLYDHATLSARPLRCPTLPPPPPHSTEKYSCTVFGPTCDGLDVVLTDYLLPELRSDDWLVFPDMGAYTICGASNFNGIQATDVATYYVHSGLA